MKSLLLLSVILLGLYVPAVTSRHRDPRRGLRRMVVLLLAVNAAYLAYVSLVHTQLFVPHW